MEPVIVAIIDSQYNKEDLPLFACLTTDNGLNFSKRGNRRQIERWIRDMSILITDAYGSVIQIQDDSTLDKN